MAPKPFTATVHGDLRCRRQLAKEYVPLCGTSLDRSRAKQQGRALSFPHRQLGANATYTEQLRCRAKKVVRGATLLQEDALKETVVFPN